jgi:hypothetical protein
MARKPTKRKRVIPPARRVDVTRLEYQYLLELGEHNAASIKRIEQTCEIQLRRCAEIQAEVDLLKAGRRRRPY